MLSYIVDTDDIHGCRDISASLYTTAKTFCACVGFFLCAPALFTQRKDMLVKSTSDFKLAVGVNESVQAYLSLPVSLTEWQPVQDVHHFLPNKRRDRLHFQKTVSLISG